MNLSLDQQAQEQYRLFLEGVQGCGVFLMDPQGLIQTWNEAAARIMGYTGQEVVGKHFFLFDPQSEKADAKLRRELATALRQGRFEQEVWQIRKDRSLFWANVIITPFYDQKGQLAGFAKVIQDWTHRKQYEDALLCYKQEKRQQARLLSLIIEKSPVGMALFEPRLDDQGQVIDFIFRQTNQANAVTSNLSVERLTGHSLATLFPQIQNRSFWNEMVDCYQTGQPQPLTGNFQAYGLDLWIDGWFYKLDNQVLWMGLDVSELKRAQVALEQQLISLQEAKHQVEIDLDRIRVAEKEVGKALDAEREVNKLKTEFINLISHQFRNPLISIYLKAEAMKRLSEGCSDRTFAQKVVAYSEQVGRDIHRLNRLINEVLYNERLRLGQIDLHQQRVNVVELCRNLIHQQKQQDTSYQRVNFTSEKETVLLWADPLLLEQVLENLMSNALKYSADSGKPVEVSLEETAGEWVVGVKDYGIGIPADDLKHVTKSFYRASNTKLYPGTGLGLSLSHRFAQMHGGRLTIESEEGQYTICRVNLPKQASVKTA